MIPRYTPLEIGNIWTDENKFRKWLQVEIAVCEVLSEMGQIPEEAVRKIKQNANFSLDRIGEIENRVKHDVIAFLGSVSESLGPEARYVHWGLTSSDVVDTAQALIVKEASELILGAMQELTDVIRRKAFEHQRTVMVGRTHGVHAEVTTFGLKLAVWYDEMRRHLARMRQASETMRYGKISGAVGTFAHLSPKVEEAVCAKLGLRAAPVSTQVLQRDHHAEYIGTLALIASSYDKFATEIRHLQRTEVREVEEPFARTQQGSSAMPHKRNPVSCEQISGLARVLRGYVQVGLENVALWHERDISHSSAERVILPDSTILAYYLTRRMTSIVRDLVVYPDRMRENLNLTSGLIFSGQLLLELTRAGVPRAEAYSWVQRASMRVWDEGVNFKAAVLSDPHIPLHLSPQQIEAAFDIETQLKNVNYVFERVFGSDS